MMAEKSGLSFADGVYDRVLPILTRATSVSEFGNGRYVRNLLEKAQMRQASRIMHLDPERITEKVAMTLTEDDFAEVRLHAAKSSRKAIGFTA